uniref:Anticodon-binding domain-containing protein n=1 Tax=Amphimedon queenslandica TaxID=400682 RepID=A0A1X7UNU6_AMPQE
DIQLISKAMDLYDKLDSRYPGEVVLDDRSQLSIGERVRHIELLGYPIAVVIGLKLQENHFELHLQSEKDKIIKVAAIAYAAVHCTFLPGSQKLLCGHAVNYEVTGDSATGSLPDCSLNEEKCPVSQYKGIESGFNLMGITLTSPPEVLM